MGESHVSTLAASVYEIVIAPRRAPAPGVPSATAGVDA
jgi:hypothetical protein